MLKLANGDLTLSLAPEHGGSVMGFEMRRPDRTIALFRPAPEGAGVFDAACFPLVPFSNRVREGTFAFHGRTIQLAPNVPGQKHPLHGQAWLAPWSVVTSSSSSAEIRFVHDPGDWPWAYEARQIFSLEPSALSIMLICRNLADEPMPCGLGLHPYFPCTPRTVLDTQVKGVWLTDAETMPSVRVEAEGRYDLALRRICGAELDNGFDGWLGTATITWPVDRLALTMLCEVPYLQVYAPEGQPFFAAEPVTHANAALNAPEAEWAAQGIRVSAPGEEMSLTVRFVVEAD